MKIKLGYSAADGATPGRSTQSPPSRRALLRKSVGLPRSMFRQSVSGEQNDALPWDRSEPWRGQVPPEYYGDPIFLYGTCVASPGADASPNLKLLQNPNKGPMEIHEIRFRLVSPFGLTSLAQVTGAVIACKLTLGDFDLTNGYVPVYLFDGTDNYSVVEDSYNVGLGLAQDSYYAEYTWRLAQPIWVPSGSVLAVTFQHKGQIANAVRVRIGYVGKSYPVNTPPPRRMLLPYVAAYSSKVFDTKSNIADTDTSSELDLYNGTDSTMHLTKMVGRQNVIANFSNGQLAVNTEIAETYTSQSGGTPYGGDTVTAVNIEMVSSQGYPIIKSQTPMRMAFDLLSRTISTPGVDLEPGDFYLVTCNVPILTGNSTGAMDGAASTGVQIGVSLVGYREIS